MKSLRRKYMGAEWLFVDDPELPKTNRACPDDIKLLDEKFSKVCIENPITYAKINRYRSQENLMKPSESLKSLNGKSNKYRCPWYIHPKHWQQLSKVPEVKKDDVQNRAKNLYYFLHKSEPNLNPLNKRDEKMNKYDMLYTESQKKLASLPIVHNYKK